jgi:OOP family OmpA-OmpF porin
MMRRTILMVAVACFLLTGLASTAMAAKCDYHSWPRRGCKKPAKVVLDGIYFASGSAKIMPKSYPVLNDNVEKLKKVKKLPIIVVGYTDNQGGTQANERLSLARANSVKGYFISHGIDASRLSAVGRGESNPIDDNSTRSGRARNRRIEIEFGN